MELTTNNITSLNGEIWKPFDNKYLVSNMGRVYNMVRNKFRAIRTDNNGYNFIGVNCNGKDILLTIHKLVVWVFGDCNGKELKYFNQLKRGNNRINGKCMSIDHINGDKSDNRQINLQLVSHKANIKRLHRKLSEDKSKQ